MTKLIINVNGDLQKLFNDFMGEIIYSIKLHEIRIEDSFISTEHNEKLETKLDNLKSVHARTTAPFLEGIKMITNFLDRESQIKYIIEAKFSLPELFDNFIKELSDKFPIEINYSSEDKGYLESFINFAKDNFSDLNNVTYNVIED